MPYSNFTFKKIRKDLGITDNYKSLFEVIPEIQPDTWLVELLAIGMQEDLAFFSEKSRSESIVFPILLALRKHNHNQIAIYSGANLEADKNQDLNGECDFILSKGRQSLELDAPLFCIVEAKDNDIEKAIPQCVAQMVGARIFNQNEGNAPVTIYGCATTGTEWQFLQLDGNTVWIDTKRYYLNKLAEILGVIQAIINN